MNATLLGFERSLTSTTCTPVPAPPFAAHSSEDAARYAKPSKYPTSGIQLSRSVRSSSPISWTFLLPAGRCPPGPPCCSSPGGGPSSGFQPLLGGTPQAVPPAVTSENAHT